MEALNAVLICMKSLHKTCCFRLVSLISMLFPSGQFLAPNHIKQHHIVYLGMCVLAHRLPAFTASGKSAFCCPEPQPHTTWLPRHVAHMGRLWAGANTPLFSSFDAVVLLLLFSSFECYSHIEKTASSYFWSAEIAFSSISEITILSMSKIKKQVLWVAGFVCFHSH